MRVKIYGFDGQIFDIRLDLLDLLLHKNKHLVHYPIKSDPPVNSSVFHAPPYWLANRTKTISAILRRNSIDFTRQKRWYYLVKAMLSHGNINAFAILLKCNALCISFPPLTNRTKWVFVVWLFSCLVISLVVFSIESNSNN